MSGVRNCSSLLAKLSHVRQRGNRRLFAAALLALSLTAAGTRLCAQTAQPSAAAHGAQQTAGTPAPQAAVPRVTTNVVVHGEIKNTYNADSINVLDLDGATRIGEIPLSVSAVTELLLADQGARVLVDVVKNDASVGEDYAPVGYYGVFTIRGFPLDLASAIQIDGLTVAGEQDVPLENKSQVEFVKGIAGLESGVASAGGVINFTTRSPLSAYGFDLATDHRGGSFGALDVGRAFNRATGSGVSVTLAGESMHPYVEHAPGWRGIGATRLDKALDAATMLTTTFEYQHKVERSEAGYQLLGGTTVPTHVYPSTMLGYQSWSKPNTFDTFNAGARVRRQLARDWSAVVRGSYSHSLIDDNVIYPYGAALDKDGNSLCPDSPYYFFCPDGSYEIYDYRSPGELRTNAVGEALVTGRLHLAGIEHHLAGGGELLARKSDLSTSTVYTLLGVENVNKPNVSYAVESPYQIAGPTALADFNRQLSAILQDRAYLPHGIILQAGGRLTRVSDFNYSSARHQWLPQFAASWTPQRIAARPLTFYANYGVLLSLGPQAPWWTDNSNAFLDPFFTRQTEAGVKFQRGLLFTADYFRMRQPYFYPRVIQVADAFCSTKVTAGDLCFESQGHETHDGVEFAAQGKLAAWAQINASVAVMRAQGEDTLTAAYDGKQVVNVPKVRTAMTMDLAPTWARGLHLMPGWTLTSRKQAARDATVNVGGYSLFNLGARYTPGGEKGHVTMRLYADNVLNRRYWKDTGANYGDTFIHQGAPATVRLSMHYSF